MATRNMKEPNRSIPCRQGKPHPIKARKSSGRYNKDSLRKYLLIYDPQGLFAGGWFFSQDLQDANKQVRGWLRPGMVFERRGSRDLIIVEHDRSLAEVSGPEAEEILAVLWEYDAA